MERVPACQKVPYETKIHKLWRAYVINYTYTHAPAHTHVKIRTNLHTPTHKISCTVIIPNCMDRVTYCCIKSCWFMKGYASMSLIFQIINPHSEVDCVLSRYKYGISRVHLCWYIWHMRELIAWILTCGSTSMKKIYESMSNLLQYKTSPIENTSVL